MTQPIWGVDVSDWQRKTVDESLIDWEGLAEHGCRFAIIKAGGSGRDSKFTGQQVAEAIGVGIPVHLYYWLDPTVPVTVQLNHVYAVQQRFPGVVIDCVDVEQWWTDWVQYNLFVRGKAKREDVPVVDPKKVVDHAAEFLAGLRSQLGGKQLTVYTAEWFVKRYASTIPKILGWHWLWTADYVSNPKVTVTWEEFGVLVERAVTGLSTPVTGVPLNQQIIRQWTGRVRLPGNKADVDANVWLGNPDDFLLWLSGNLGDPASHPKQFPALATVTVDRANLRSAPGKDLNNVVGSLVQGTTVEVLGDENGWYRLGRKLYIATSVVRRILR